MIHDELVTYEVAKLAKEKGFPLQKVVKQDGRAFFYELPQTHPDWANCDAWYLPTQSLLQRWLREEKGVCIAIYPNLRVNYSFEWIGYKKDEKCWTPVVSNMKEYNTYELAFEDALKYALENLI